MPDSSDVQREVEAEARRLFPGAVRRVEWLGYGDSPLIERLEPAELEAVDRLITAGVAASRAEALRWALGRVREDGA